MIDVHTEQIVTFTVAAKSLPSRPHVSTLWRWRQRGICGVKLESVNIGGRTYTSHEALARFIEQVTAARNGHQVVPVRTSRQRTQQRDAARQQLRAAGLID